SIALASYPLATLPLLGTVTVGSAALLGIGGKVVGLNVLDVASQPTATARGEAALPFAAGFTGFYAGSQLYQTGIGFKVPDVASPAKGIFSTIFSEPPDLSFSGLRSTIENTIYGYRQGSMGIENIGSKSGSAFYSEEPYYSTTPAARTDPAGYLTGA